MNPLLNIYDTIKKDNVDARFVDVVEHRYKIPIGGWAADPKLKKLGLWNLLSLLQWTHAEV
jgi:hypothetical protein